MIELVDFGKDYGDFTAVKCLNLKIAAGEMFGFIGPNGAGKSTSIRFLATLLKPSRGKGFVNGFNVAEARLEVKALLKELRRMGKTILISSHILTELADCCTSIGIIERGELLMNGSIDEVYRRIRKNRIINIKFVDGMDAGLSIIRSMPECVDVDVDRGQVTCELQTDDLGVASLLKKLVDNQVNVRTFAEKDPTLEDVFMMVTKGLVT